MRTKKLEMKQEAIKRLEILDLHPHVLPNFVNEGRIHVSEYQKILGQDVGVLFWANDEQMKYIREFEEKNGVLVYHAILTPFIFGECLSLLYVSKYEIEWEQERAALRRGRTPAYVYNIKDPDYSEAGMISIRKAFGGLIRTA